MYPVLLTHGLFFNLNTKQITRDDTHMHRYISIQQFFGQLSPLLLNLCSNSPLLRDSTPLFTYLENQVLLFMVRIPILSCPWFAINCSPLAASPTPRHLTYQITYLHRRHQQRQPSCLTQVAPFVTVDAR
jgi:hypothetical protein